MLSRIKSLFFLIIFLLICSVILSPKIAKSQPFYIKMHSRVEVMSNDIRLGDIAEIKTPTWQQMKRLGDIVIVPAPPFGKSRSIRPDDVMAKLKQNNIDSSNVVFEWPSKIIVTRSVVQISKKEIEQIVASQIQKSSWWDNENIKLKRVEINDDIVLPKGNITYHIDDTLKFDLGNPIRVPVTITVGDIYKKKVNAFVYKEVFAEVVVVTNMLRRYQLITEDDITLKRMNVNELSSNIILKPEEVLGKRSKRAIYPKTVLRADLVELPPIIKRKDIVTIMAVSGKLKVTALGEAMERGRQGDRIRVVNTDSGEKVYARVLDPKTVRIDF